MAESMLIIYNFFLRITLNRQKNVKRDCGRIENTLYFPAFIFPWLFEQEVPHFHFSEPENEVSMKIVTSGPITSWEIDGETVETVSDFIFLGSKITADGDCIGSGAQVILLPARCGSWEDLGSRAMRREAPGDSAWIL